MLKIGEFSRLSQVTVKTLHHYDDIGLLKPAQIDQFTGYRYYSVDQLARIHRIIALKDLGLSLDQIAVMLNEDLAHDEIRGMLRLQQAEIQQRVREEQARLSQVEFRLRMIEMEDKMPEMDIIVKKIPPLYALTLRRSMIWDDMVPFGLEIEQAQAQHGVRLVGPVTEIRFEEEYQPGHEDVEFVLPVADTHKKCDAFEYIRYLRTKDNPRPGYSSHLHSERREPGANCRKTAGIAPLDCRQWLSTVQHASPGLSSRPG